VSYSVKIKASAAKALSRLSHALVVRIGHRREVYR
jgi:hypothetical protein